MKCTYHPEANAVSACANCGRLICAECKTVLGGKVYCNPCGEKLFTGASISHEIKSPNWFQRHLNWTVVLASAGAYMVAGITGIAPHWSIAIMGLLATLALGFGVCSWALTEKNRSGWWLLLLFIPFGWIAFLNLENRSHIPKLTNNEYERETEWAEFTALPEISEENYIGNKKTHTFHHPDCYQAQHIGYENAVWFESSADAIIEGYEPCKLCNPE